jgi:hypothetical protein
MQEFPKVSEAKKKEEIFVGPQITQLFEQQDKKQSQILQKEEPGRQIKMSAETFSVIKTGKITVKLCRSSYHHTITFNRNYIFCSPF